MTILEIAVLLAIILLGQSAFAVVRLVVPSDREVPSSRDRLIFVALSMIALLVVFLAFSYALRDRDTSAVPLAALAIGVSQFAMGAYYLKPRASLPSYPLARKYWRRLTYYSLAAIAASLLLLAFPRAWQ